MISAYRIEKWEAKQSPDAAVLKKILEKDGFMTFQWSDQPGAVYPPHSHGEDQSHCIVSGKLELDVEGYGRFVLEAGDRDFMPAGTVHAARVLGDEPVVYLIGRKAQNSH
ncbi:MAG: cupin domain-containing protein [Acidobacteria bacterium]|nr:MAG: cupin domain-containing protein [Acidobacteriota bacterium]REK04189.1 MAG: cupin domain-containing protein [Acidobacteriota bacterium]REK15351.1 MAG: cupin domain-containing protein [Acidobacteriota bacterium]REK46441.1 MAG: cupin domain-containing protein [Acidobacteriota bacterium]